MDGKGIMERIRELFAKGHTRAEIIALGYKPPTVDKVQRQLRRAAKTNGEGSVKTSDGIPESTVLQVVKDTAPSRARFNDRISRLHQLHNQGPELITVTT